MLEEAAELKGIPSEIVKQRPRNRWMLVTWLVLGAIALAGCSGSILELPFRPPSPSSPGDRFGDDPVVEVQIDWNALEQMIAATTPAHGAVAPMQSGGPAQQSMAMQAGLPPTHVGIRLEYTDREAHYAQSIERRPGADAGKITIVPAPGTAHLQIAVVHRADASPSAYGEHFVLGWGSLRDITLLEGTVTTIDLEQIERDAIFTPPMWKLPDVFEKDYATDPPVLALADLRAHSPRLVGPDAIYYPVEINYPFQYPGRSLDHYRLLIHPTGTSGGWKYESGWLSGYLGCAVGIGSPVEGEEISCWAPWGPELRPYSQISLRETEFSLPRATYHIPPLPKEGFAVRWDDSEPEPEALEPWEIQGSISHTKDHEASGSWNVRWPGERGLVVSLFVDESINGTTLSRAFHEFRASRSGWGDGFTFIAFGIEEGDQGPRDVVLFGSGWDNELVVAILPDDEESFTLFREIMDDETLRGNMQSMHQRIRSVAQDADDVIYGSY